MRQRRVLAGPREETLSSEEVPKRRMMDSKALEVRAAQPSRERYCSWEKREDDRIFSTKSSLTRSGKRLRSKECHKKGDSKRCFQEEFTRAVTERSRKDKKEKICKKISSGVAEVQPKMRGDSEEMLIADHSSEDGISCASRGSEEK